MLVSAPANPGEIPGQALFGRPDPLRTGPGENFDIRAFHDTVLENGAVPLDLLERLVDDWIERQR